MPPSSRRRGVLITLLGVLVLTPDALLIRLAEADSWVIVAWRGYLMFAVFLALLVWEQGRASLSCIAAAGATGALGGLLYALSTIGFVTAINMTKAADVLVVLAAMPLFAALLGRIIFRERLYGATWLAALLVVAGLAVTVSGNIVKSSPAGMAIAVAGMLTLAATLTLIRHARGLSNLYVFGLGGLISALVGHAFAPTLALPPDRLVYIVLMGVIIAPLSMLLIARGLKDLPSAEVGLFMLLETVLGPLWVWFAVHETPTKTTFLGGAVVLAAVSLHLGGALMRAKPRGSAAHGRQAGAND